MQIFQIKDYSFTYPLSKEPALKDVTLTLEEGKFYVLCGKSGSGKSTLLRRLKSVLATKGEERGSIYYYGRKLDEVLQREQSASIGFVFQNPDNQIVTDKVWHELAFGLESLGYDTQQIHLRVAEMASYFGITDWFHKEVSELSGGQKQLLNLAAVMTMHPKILILDEATSQLDPVATYDFLNTLRKINLEFGITILLSEHNLEDVANMADSIIVMDSGKIIAQGTLAEIEKYLKHEHHDMFQALPTPIRIYAKTDSQNECPYTVAMGRQFLAQFVRQKKVDNRISADTAVAHSKKTLQNRKTILEMRGVCFRYDKDLPDVVCSASLQIYEGEMLALMGGNGTGKSTALHLLAGLLKPHHGEILLKGKSLKKYSAKELYHGMINILPQDPTALFANKTVEAELNDIEAEDKRKQEIVELTHISSLLERHPFDLSGGEQQRVALAKVLLCSPKILLLDEPTKGLDAWYKKEFGEILQELKKQNVTIVIVSHDLEFCARYADRVGMFFDGDIATVQETKKFFSGNHFYTTAANRMARDFFPNAITAEEVVLCINGKAEKEDGLICDEEKESVLICTSTGAKKGSRSDSTLEQEKKGITSCEKYSQKRKDVVRKLVVIAVLTALAVAGRAAFFMVPSIKPMAAITIVAGISLGAKSGCTVGMLSMLVSNMLFGQGPWTPYQMLAMGLIGLFAGVIFCRDGMQKRKVWMCLYGFISVMILYGGIMNPASLLMTSYKVTLQSLYAIYLSGLPLDLIHAVSTVIFLLLAGNPMLEKLERVKVRYHIMVD